MQLYSCAYDYCANVSGDPNAKANEIPKPTKKPIKSANGKQGSITFEFLIMYSKI